MPEQAKVQRRSWTWILVLGGAVIVTLVAVAGACLALPLILRELELETHPLEGQLAPEFSAPVVAGEGIREGELLRLSDLRGQPVVIDFWASWCGPCRRAMPDLNRIHERHRAAGLHVLGVNGDGRMPAHEIAAVGRSFGATFPSVSDADEAIQRAYRVESMPMTVVIDAEGVIRHVHVGAHDADDLDAEIRGLLR